MPTEEQMKELVKDPDFRVRLDKFGDGVQDMISEIAKAYGFKVKGLNVILSVTCSGLESDIPGGKSGAVLARIKDFEHIDRHDAMAMAIETLNSTKELRGILNDNK